jgi:predicted nucleic acid-binding protein
MKRRKYISAIYDTYILIHLAKAGHLSLLNQPFEAVYIPEYIFKNELRKKAGALFHVIGQAINDPDSIFILVADSDLDLTQKQVKKLTLNEIGDLVGRGEAECAALSKAKDIPIIISDNSTEFKYLSEFIMLTYFDLLTLCVHHGIMDVGEAEAIYIDINSILDHKSSDSFEVKHRRIMKRISTNGWDKILL